MITNPNPDGWFEYICIKSHVPTGSSHTGDLIDVGNLFSFCRYAKNQLSNGYGVRPWIPEFNGSTQGHWDHVLTSAPFGTTIPYSDETWQDLVKLAETAEHFRRAINLVVSEGTIHFASALLQGVIAEVTKVVGPERIKEVFEE